MHSIKTILQTRGEGREVEAFQKSERAELVKKFVDRLNVERKRDGYPPIEAKVVAIKLSESKLTTQDLYWFWSYCNEAKNFSSCFWWALKAKE